MGREGRAERLVGAIGLRNDHHAGRVLVQAVHDAGTLNAADAGQRAGAMMQQSVHQSAGPIAGGGMNGHAGGFVHNDQVRVLEQNFERDVLGARRGRFRIGKVQHV